MSELSGSRTERNLTAAFAGESQARIRYELAASVAKKEGYVHIADVLERIALQELSHAKSFFKLLVGGSVEVTFEAPAGAAEGTPHHLQLAIAGERHEQNHLYPRFADEAAEEGFAEIAALFRAIAQAEKRHADRLESLLELVKTDSLYAHRDRGEWECTKCGYVHVGGTPPPKCPGCAHSRGYFEPVADNW